MKHGSLLAAVAVVLLANAFALIHAARNHAGQTEAEITLTERELNYYADKDDSGVALSLRWVDVNPWPYSPVQATTWLNQAKLQELGFDCSIAPSDPNAALFYSRQSARTGFVALEYDGASWQSWLELRRQLAQAQPVQMQSNPDYDRRSATRLVVIDAARQSASLRARHPDRNRSLILPAVIRITSTVGSPAGAAGPAKLAYLTGYIQEMPSLIHVPRPFSDNFRAFHITGGYRVHLRYGRFLEPWVTAVEFAEHP